MPTTTIDLPADPDALRKKRDALADELTAAKARHRDAADQADALREQALDAEALAEAGATSKQDAAKLRHRASSADREADEALQTADRLRRALQLVTERHDEALSEHTARLRKRYRAEAAPLIRELSELLTEAHRLNAKLFALEHEAQQEGAFIGWHTFDPVGVRYSPTRRRSALAMWLHRVQSFDPVTPDADQS